ncbi:MAG: NAD-dependent epimerase/dehydratase family protein, partial [Bacteroidota bacterium]
MKNVLVTGGAGFIGSNLVKLLLSENCQVRVLDNLSSGYKKNIQGLDVDFTQGDIRDASLVERLCQGMDVVFHLAASVGRQKSLDHPREDSEVNLIGTTNVLEGSRKANVRRVVYTSSAAIFGELLTMPIAEDHPQNPDSPYGVSKLAGEKQALCYAGLYNITVVCLRYFNVFGVNQRYDAYGNVIPIFANRIYGQQHLTIYGDGEQTRDFVNVKDVAMVNYLSATVAEQSGVYNIGSGSSITINELARIMKTVSGKDVPVVYEPQRPADVRHCRADISKARQELGFNPGSDL